MPLVQILALAGVLTVFGLVSATLFAAHALLRQAFSISLGSVLLRITLLIFLIARFGLYGAAIAAAIAICVEQGLYLLLTIRHIDLRLSALIQATWRCLLATAAMAAVLLHMGLGRHEAGANPAALARQLVIAIGVGAAAYAIALLAAWLASGRPSGAETDLVALIRRMGSRLTGGLWSR